MTAFSVDSDAVLSATSAIRATADRLQGETAAMLGQLTQLQGAWTGSLWLTDMASEKTGVPTISLRNPYDNYVMPQDNQKLPGARDVELPPTGHIAQLYDARVAAAVLRHLDD